MLSSTYKSMLLGYDNLAGIVHPEINTSTIQLDNQRLVIKITPWFSFQLLYAFGQNMRAQPSRPRHQTSPLWAQRRAPGIRESTTAHSDFPSQTDTHVILFNTLWHICLISVWSFQTPLCFGLYGTLWQWISQFNCILYGKESSVNFKPVLWQFYMMFLEIKSWEIVVYSLYH